MKPKAGKAGTLVSPVAPTEAVAAASADPGENAKLSAEQGQAKAGEYGSEKAAPYKPPSEQEKKDKPHWIEVLLVDKDGHPVAGEKYSIKLPDNREATGTLSDKGLVRLEGLDSGNCEITFPDLEKSAWEPA